MLADEVLKENVPLIDEQVEQALAVQHETGQSLADVVVGLGFCSQEQVCAALARQAGVPLVQIREAELDPRVISLIPAELAYRHQSLPLTVTDSYIRVAVADPFNISAADDIRLVTGLAVELVFADPREIRRLVEEHYMRRMISDTADEEVQVLDDSKDEIGDLERMAREATVVKLVNLILRQAVQ